MTPEEVEALPQGRFYHQGPINLFCVFFGGVLAIGLFGMAVGSAPGRVGGFVAAVIGLAALHGRKRVFYIEVDGNRLRSVAGLRRDVVILDEHTTFGSSMGVPYATRGGKRVLLNTMSDWNDMWGQESDELYELEQALGIR